MTPFKHEFPTESPSAKRPRHVFKGPLSDVSNLLKQEKQVPVELKSPNETNSMKVFVSNDNSKIEEDSRTAFLTSTSKVLFPSTDTPKKDETQKMFDRMQQMEAEMKLLKEKDEKREKEMNLLMENVKLLKEKDEKREKEMNLLMENDEKREQEIKQLKKAGIYLCKMILVTDSQLTLLMAGLGLREVDDRVTKAIYYGWKRQLQGKTAIADFYDLSDGIEQNTLTAAEWAALNDWKTQNNLGMTSSSEIVSFRHQIITGKRPFNVLAHDGQPMYKFKTQIEALFESDLDAIDTKLSKKFKSWLMKSMDAAFKSCPRTYPQGYSNWSLNPSSRKIMEQLMPSTSRPILSTTLDDRTQPPIIPQELATLLESFKTPTTTPMRRATAGTSNQSRTPSTPIILKISNNSSCKKKKKKSKK